MRMQLLNALFDNMSYVQRKVWNFVHSWVLLKDYNISLGGQMCCQDEEEGAGSWFFSLSLFSTFGVVLTPICHTCWKYSPQVRMRWAWARTQRWSTWWRWSSCRRAGPAGREALRQTKYRKGQNTDEEGIEMCPKLLPLLLFLGRWISTEKWLNLTNWRAAQFRDRDFLIADAKGNSGSFLNTIFLSRGLGNFCANTQF